MGLTLSLATRQHLFRTVFFDRRGVRWFWRALLLVLFLALGSVAFGGVWFVLDIPPRRAEGVINFWPYVATGVSLLAICAGAIHVAMRLTEARGLSTIGLTAKNAPALIAFGAIVGCLTPLLFVAAMHWRGDAAFAVNSFAASDTLMRMLPMLVVFICMAGFEELFLRGYALQLLIEGVGQRWAVVISSALFGLMHSSNPGANLLGLLNNAVIGGLLALLVIRTGSLLFVWAYHAAWNAFSTFVFGLSVSGHDLALFSVFNTTLSGTEAMTGGAYGFEGSILIGPIETAVLLIAFLLAPSAKTRNYFQQSELLAARSLGAAPLQGAAGELDVELSAPSRRAG